MRNALNAMLTVLLANFRYDSVINRWNRASKMAFMHRQIRRNLDISHCPSPYPKLVHTSRDAIPETDQLRANAYEVLVAERSVIHYSSSKCFANFAGTTDGCCRGVIGLKP